MKRSFTVVELLVCLAIVGILAALLIPFLMEARTTINNNAKANTVLWEEVYKDSHLERTKTPEGWIVLWNRRIITYVPDPDHKWVPVEVEEK